jgi:hypothetical protein
MRLDKWDDQATMTIWFDNFAEFNEWTKKFPKDLILITESQNQQKTYFTFGFIVKIAYPLFLKCLVPIPPPKKDDPIPALAATEIPMESLGIQEVAPSPMGSPS